MQACDATQPRFSTRTFATTGRPGQKTVESKVTAPDGTLARGTAVIDINRGTVTATLDSVPDTGGFDLWFVKNVAGGTVAPEATDQMIKIGSFQGTGPSRTLTASLGINVFFDLDLLVVTRPGKAPSASLNVRGTLR